MAASVVELASAQAESRDAKPLVEAILNRYHGPLRGTFDSAALRLSTPDTDATMQIVVAMPDRMRVDAMGAQQVELLVHGVGWRCAGGQPAKRLEHEDLAALDHLRNHLRGLLLQPLVDAKHAARLAPGIVSLQLPGGETWRLEVDEPRLQLIELRGPAGRIRFLEFLDTGPTKHPAKVDLEGIGERRIEFVASDLYLDRAVFEDPFVVVDHLRSRQGQASKTVHDSPRELPPAPEIQWLDSRTFLATPDPGDWAKRIEVLRSQGAGLTAQGQIGDGLPIYQLADRTALLIPFRPSPARGHPPFVRQAGQVVEHQPAHRAVVVAPPPGSWEQVVREGRALLASYLAGHKLEARGPLRVIPFLEPTLQPSPEEQTRLRLRFELPIGDG